VGYPRPFNESGLMDLAKQVADFVLAHDTVQNKKVDSKVLENAFKVLIDKNRIIFTKDLKGDILGFIESWRIGYKELGFIVCHKDTPVSVLSAWEIEKGNICYIANMVIHPQHRNGAVMKYIKGEFFKQNFMCDFFIGERRSKKHQPVIVLNRQDFYDKYEVREAVQSGIK